MKIAVMVHSLNRIGGIAKHTLYLSREFVAMGHQVVVWSVEFDKNQCYPEITQELNIQMLRSTCHPTSDDTQHPPGIRLLAYMWSLWRYYQDQRRLFSTMPGGYDVVNAHGNTINWAAAEYKRWHRTPVVWMCNDFWPVGSHRNEIVSSYWEKITHAAKEILCFPFVKYDKEAVRKISKIAVLSEKVKSQMVEHYCVNPVVVRTGVDSFRFAQGDRQIVRARHLICNDAFLLLTICELMPRRRIEDVIRAIRILVDEGLNVIYLVVGRTSHSPAYTQYVQAEASIHDLSDRVKFVGEVSEEELVDYYHACDAFIWASDENQSWGMAAMEAMAAGKPVIVSKANGLAEVLEDSTTALLVNPRSPEAIAVATKRLMVNPMLANFLASQGQVLVRERYSWRRHAEEMLALFHEAIENQ